MRQFVFLLAMASAGVALATPRTDQNAPWNVNFNPDGIPLFYYGDEQGFSSQGTALDGWSREDFMTSKPWFTVPDHSGGRLNPAVFDNFNQSYAPDAASTVDDPAQSTEAWVQYWADGSAAYFSRGPMVTP